MFRASKLKTLPYPPIKKIFIDLTAGDMGSFFCLGPIIFLKDELAKVQPLIPERLRENLQTRILDPFMNRTFWWMATNATPETMVNNWNPVV